MFPEMPLLPNGFSLNNEARKFFGSYFNQKKFSFTKSLSIKWREIQKNKDVSATLQDLIDSYKKK